MSYSHLVHVISLILVALAGALLLSAAVAFGYGDGDGWAFLVSTAICAGVGFVGWRLTGLRRDLNVREGYAVVALAWLTIGVGGALPFLLADVVDSPIAALFESVSGFTTTGATVFGDIEALPHGILFWRALTQWIGGMGIILLGIAILPFLGIGGMQLFRAEVPGPTPERLQPRIAQTAKLLWAVYAGLTALEVLLLAIGGMTLFDAVLHAFATMSTGGFSPRNASIAAYPSPFIQYVIIAFMYLAGINFALHYRAMMRRSFGYSADHEWRFYTVAILIATVVILLVTPAVGGAGAGPEADVRHALFQVMSIVTTTGFISYDYELWTVGAQFMLVLFMFMCGMAGSTSGGMKVMRVHVMLRHGVTELKKSLHPRAVILTRIGRKALPEGVLLNVLAFILLYIAIFAAGALGLTLLGHDLETAIGGAASAIGNIGPGLGELGPVDNYGWLAPGSHAILIFLMLVGRLEIFTVLVLFHPDLWRHWRGATLATKRR